MKTNTTNISYDGVKTNIPVLNATTFTASNINVNHLNSTNSNLQQQLTALNTTISNLPQVDLTPTTNRVSALETKTQYQTINGTQTRFTDVYVTTLSAGNFNTALLSGLTGNVQTQLSTQSSQISAINTNISQISTNVSNQGGVINTHTNNINSINVNVNALQALTTKLAYNYEDDDMQVLSNTFTIYGNCIANNRITYTNDIPINTNNFTLSTTRFVQTLNDAMGLRVSDSAFGSNIFTSDFLIPFNSSKFDNDVFSFDNMNFGYQSNPSNMLYLTNYDNVPNHEGIIQFKSNVSSNTNTYGMLQWSSFRLSGSNLYEYETIICNDSDTDVYNSRFGFISGSTTNNFSIGSLCWGFSNNAYTVFINGTPWYTSPITGSLYQRWVHLKITIESNNKIVFYVKVLTPYTGTDVSQIGPTVVSSATFTYTGGFNESLLYTPCWYVNRSVNGVYSVLLDYYNVKYRCTRK